MRLEIDRWLAGIGWWFRRGSLSTKKGPVEWALDESEVERVNQGEGVIDLNVAKVQRFCDRKIPAQVRGELVWEVETRGQSITIYERRPPWPGAPDPNGPWTKREIAQFRLDEASRMWTLYWADRNGRPDPHR